MNDLQLFFASMIFVVGLSAIVDGLKQIIIDVKKSEQDYGT